MILKYYFQKEKYSWKELGELTGKKEGLWTWPLYGMIRLKEKGFDIINMEDFDYEKFINLGKQYILERFGKEVGTAQIKNSDIPYEINNAKIYQKNFDFPPCIPTFDDIKKLLDEGYLIITNVNSKALNGIDGYIGHFVLIYNLDEKNLFIHDPGLPPFKARKVSHDRFTKAWAYPSEKEKNLIALRYHGF
jgi:hypothetical protein